MLHNIPKQRDAVNTKDEEPYLTAQQLLHALSFMVDDVILRPPHVKILLCFGILTHPGPFAILKARASKWVTSSCL